MSLPHTPPSHLSPEEQQYRREHIEQGVTQLRLEGLEPPAIYWECAERYIQGELTLDEMHTLLLQHFTRTPCAPASPMPQERLLPILARSLL